MGLRSSAKTPIKILRRAKVPGRHSLDDLLLSGANEQIKRVIDQVHRRAKTLKGDILGWNVDEVSGRLAKAILLRARAISNALQTENRGALRDQSGKVATKSRGGVGAKQKRRSERTQTRSDKKDKK